MKCGIRRKGRFQEIPMAFKECIKKIPLIHFVFKNFQKLLSIHTSHLGMPYKIHTAEIMEMCFLIFVEAVTSRCLNGQAKEKKAC